jgi:hypothetical protein
MRKCRLGDLGPIRYDPGEAPVLEPNACLIESSLMDIGLWFFGKDSRRREHLAFSILKFHRVAR